MKILFLGKTDCEYTLRAVKFISKCNEVEVHLSKWGNKFPSVIHGWEGDLLISYNARWIVPAHVISHAKIAINFHPGPPEYPGIGCVNWAIYEGAPFFGVTAHHMDSTVDTGCIIQIMKFELLPSDTVDTLLERTHCFQLAQFYAVISQVLTGKALPKDRFTPWVGKSRTRSQLDALSCINTDMREEEIARRVRATTYRNWKPSITLGGKRFGLIPIV